MEKTCLVTGKSGPLLVDIVQHLAETNRQLLVTRSGQMELGQTDDDVAVISWNRRSALSSRSVLLHAVNTFGRLDEAVVVFSPAPDTSTFHESSIVGIEDRIDAEVKGYLYILREILAQLVKQGAGSVALVLHHPPDELQTPLEAAATGSFVSLVDSISRYYRNEPVGVHRFRSSDDDIPGYARFIASRLDQDAGSRTSARRRWLSYRRRRGLFQRGTG
jgi:NAD(P)-dependent dehydrogenase (short-subunit alcohol dehydrogenase family)